MRRHLEVFRRLVDGEEPDPGQELLGDACDRDVVDVHPFVADEREEQVQRPLELLQFDDKRLVMHGRRRGHPIPIA